MSHTAGKSAAPGYRAIADAISGRRSIRRYRADPVADDLIDELLTVAITAPSAHNRQPWRFRVVRSNKEKIALATAMGAQLRRDRAADGDATQLIEDDAARSYARITSAPVIIVMCLSLEDMDRYPDARRNQAEYLMAVQSVAMAGQNLQLAAAAAGLGACWVCAPLFCPAVVSTTLDLPDVWQPQGMITLGYPASAGKPFKRQPIDTLCLPATRKD